MGRIAVKKTEVFKLDELSEEAKENAISDQIEFWIETLQDTIDQGLCSDNLQKAINEAERLKTPWFLGSIIYEYCEAELIEEIKINEYEFTVEGKLY